ncbi:unnamed protein product [Parajaminaea phylloscopi]
MSVPRRDRSLAWLVIAAMACSRAVWASPLALQKRDADLDSADIVKIKGSNAPAGPLYLIFGALAIALVALIFTVVKVLLPGSISASGRRIMEERAKARTDLRVRGMSSRRGSAVGLSESNMTSPISSPTIGRNTYSDLKRPSVGSSTDQLRTGKRAAISSWSRPSLGMTDMQSLSSMADVPMLTANGRANTHFSNLSSSSGKASGSSSPLVPLAGAGSAPPGPGVEGQEPTHARRPPLPQKRSTNRSSTVYRGTDLHLTRQSSTKSHRISAGPAWVDASLSRDPGSPRGQTGGTSDIRRFGEESPRESRRNSSANLLEDGVMAVLSPADAASSPSSASDSSSKQLQPTSTHPLSRPNRPTVDTSSGVLIDYGNRNSQTEQSPPPQWHRRGTSGTAPSHFRNGLVFPDHSDSSSSLSRSPYRDLEQGPGPDHDNLPPGSLRQPVAKGNGKRGFRGSLAGLSRK